MARRKSKELKENEDDLLFYLEYWQEFPDTFKRVAMSRVPATLLTDMQELRARLESVLPHQVPELLIL